MERQLAELREYLTEKRVPKKLRGRVRHYMELLYRHKTVRHTHTNSLRYLSLEKGTCPKMVLVLGSGIGFRWLNSPGCLSLRTGF